MSGTKDAAAIVGDATICDEAYWAGLRREFPAVREHTYLRSAATGVLAPGVAAAVGGYYEDLTAGGDLAFDRWFERREQVRANLARMIGAEPDEIAFTINTSAGMNLIVDALEGSGAVVSCADEFPVTTLPWLHRGVEVRRLPTRAGVLTADDVGRALTKDAGVICLSHVQYSSGLRLDLEAIGERKAGRAFVVNASQSAGVLPIDVKRARIDALCATGHKWMLAGLGTGFVYMSRELMARTRPRQMSWMSTPDPFAMRNDDVRMRPDMAARAELGVPTLPSIFAIGAGADYLMSIGADRVSRRALELNRRLTTRLTEEGWHVLSPLADESMRSAETLVRLDDPAHVVRELAARGIYVSEKPEGMRVATHFYNDAEDIERLIEALHLTRG